MKIEILDDWATSSYNIREHSCDSSVNSTLYKIPQRYIEDNKLHPNSLAAILDEILARPNACDCGIHCGTNSKEICIEEFELIKLHN